MDSREWRERKTNRPTKKRYRDRAVDCCMTAAVIITLVVATRLGLKVGAILAVGFVAPLLGAALFYTVGQAWLKAYFKKWPNMPER